MLDLESAIKHCEEVADGQTEQGKCPECAEDHRQLAEWLTDYKRLKEQQPCEDAISRQAAQAKIKSICDEYRLSYEDGERKAATGGSAYALGHAFDDLPPVTPQPKMGHWISLDDFRGKYNEKGFKRSECDEHSYFEDSFCPGCGAKMIIEPQVESEKE